MTRIAFLGLGAMGQRMAAHLLEAHELTVYNRTASRAEALIEAGAAFAETPAVAVRDAEIVISMVTDDTASEQLWLTPEHGAIHGLRAGALVLESSTVTPEWIARLGERIHAREARLLDAPVAGSTPQAEARQLAFLVGGASEDVEEATPIMSLMGANILHAGELTHGATLKLVVNALFASQVALMAELLQAVQSAGLDQAKILGLLSKMPVTSPAAVGAANLMIAEDHAPRFPVDLVSKDLGYARNLGPMPVVAAAHGRFEEARRAGLGDKNISVVHALKP
jgi:3-hydroxyisobutyrate dehydrogenase-like beta-hydroxyacid dehydrogenase